jgi:hypothetical protein
MESKGPGDNIQMLLDAEYLLIGVDLSKEFGPTRSGRSTIIAATERASVPGLPEFGIVLTVYRRSRKRSRRET